MGEARRRKLAGEYPAQTQESEENHLALVFDALVQGCLDSPGGEKLVATGLASGAATSEAEVKESVMRLLKAGHLTLMKTRRGNEEGVVLTLAQFGAGIPPHQGSAVEGVRLVD